jgi:predicted DNA repair protein MutK
MRKSDNKGFLSSLGGILIKALPLVIKGLAVLGTIALILVSGGIFLHNIDYLHHLVPHSIPSTLAEFGVGIAFGLVAVLLMTGFKKVKDLVKK